MPKPMTTSIEYRTDTHGDSQAIDIPDTTGMTSPVRCIHCGKVYDLAAVTPIVYHADTTVFRTPCCDREADDRRWKSLPDFVELRKTA